MHKAKSKKGRWTLHRESQIKCIIEPGILACQLPASLQRRVRLQQGALVSPGALTPPPKPPTALISHNTLQCPGALWGNYYFHLYTAHVSKLKRCAAHSCPLLLQETGRETIPRRNNQREMSLSAFGFPLLQLQGPKLSQLAVYGNCSIPIGFPRN